MRIPRLLGRRLAKGDREPKPKSYAKSSGKKRDIFSRRERDVKQLETLETIYAQGGIISEAVDQYPLAIMAQGYRLEGKAGDIKRVEDVYDRIDFEALVWQGVIEALKIGNGILEICYGNGSMSEEIVAVFARAAKDFDILHDDRGIITGYRQFHVENKVRTAIVDLQPREVIDVNLLPQAGDVYGLSLIQRALDDIERDTKIAESTTEAIDRHGWRRYHIRVGKEGETVPKEDIDAVSNEFAGLSDNKTEITTQHDVEITGLDEGELPAMSYFEWTTDRLCTGLGVPEEALGLGRGSTEATAKVRERMFNARINTLKKRLGRIISQQLNDRITGVPGAVKTIFNASNIDEEVQLAELIMKLMGNAADPEMIISARMARRRMGYDEKEYQTDIDEEYAESKERTPEQLKPFVPGGEQSGNPSEGKEGEAEV